METPEDSRRGNEVYRDPLSPELGLPCESMDDSWLFVLLVRLKSILSGGAVVAPSWERP